MLKTLRLVACFLLLLAVCPSCRGETLTVSAAISLKESLEEIAKTYEASTGNHISFNFDASGKLAAQITQGAPVDVFISADDQLMNKLVQAKQIDNKSVYEIVENSLVLIVPAGKTRIRDFSDLTESGETRVAIGQASIVPAGRYAMQTLKALKLDQPLAPRLVQGQSVREVLTYVEQGEVEAGIVYASDAKLAGERVKIVATADPSTHDKIEYPAGVVTSSAHASLAGKFVTLLGTDAAQKILAQHGFLIPKTSSTRPAK